MVHQSGCLRGWRKSGCCAWLLCRWMPLRTSNSPGASCLLSARIPHRRPSSPRWHRQSTSARPACRLVRVATRPRTACARLTPSLERPKLNDASVASPVPGLGSLIHRHQPSRTPAAMTPQTHYLGPRRLRGSGVLCVADCFAPASQRTQAVPCWGTDRWVASWPNAARERRGRGRLVVHPNRRQYRSQPSPVCRQRRRPRATMSWRTPRRSWHIEHRRPGMT